MGDINEGAGDSSLASTSSPRHRGSSKKRGSADVAKKRPTASGRRTKGNAKGRRKASGRSKRKAKNGSTKQCVLGVDLGTTGVRAVLVSRDGHPIAHAYRRIETVRADVGLAEQDPEMVWERTVDVMREAVDGAGIPPRFIKCIGLSTQRGSVVLWDKSTGKAIHNCLTWQDTRTQHICDRWNKSLAARGIHVIAGGLYRIGRNEKMGIGRDFKFSPIHSTPRIYWLSQLDDAQKCLREGNLAFGTIDSWILFKMTDGRVHATDYSNISASGLWQPFENDWNKFVFGISKIPQGEDFLPSVHASQSSLYGRMGNVFDVEIPIRAVVADQGATLYAQGCTNAGDVKATLGTGGFVNICTGRKPRYSPSGLIPLIAYVKQDEENPTFMLEGSAKAIGSVVDWAGDALSLWSDASMSSEMAQSVDDSKGVIVVPSFCGFGPPINSPGVGVALGLSLDTTKAHIARGLLEGVVYTIADLVESGVADMKRMVGPRFKSIRVDGGVAQNNFICQHLADTLGCDVQRMESGCSLMTAMGAIWLAGSCEDVGIWTQQDIDAFRARTRTFEPQSTRQWRMQRRKLWREAQMIAKAYGQPTSSQWDVGEGTEKKSKKKRGRAGVGDESTRINM